MHAPQVSVAVGQSRGSFAGAIGVVGCGRRGLLGADGAVSAMAACYSLSFQARAVASARLTGKLVGSKEVRQQELP